MSDIIGKCKNPFTGQVDCSIKLNKNGKAYLVTPWGPISLKAPGYDAWCRSNAIIENEVDQPLPDTGPAPVEKTEVLPTKKPETRRGFLSEFLP